MKTSMTDISNKQLLRAMTDQLGVITDNMATKKDLDDRLKGFATKDDLKAFATKDDLRAELKSYATKADLKAFATKADVKEIVREETADIRDEQLRQGVLLEDLDDTVKKLAESVSGELKLKKNVHDHSGRIAALESKGRIVTSVVTHHSAQIKALQISKP